MKRHIFTAVLCLVAAMNLQAQELVKHSGEKINFKENKLTKIVFDTYGKNNGDDVIFICQLGDTITFDIDDIQSMNFALTYDKIDQIKQAGTTTIAYDAATATVHIVGAKEEGVICVFDTAGKLVCKGKGEKLSLSELESGLYIVNYNKILNAKILKK